MTTKKLSLNALTQQVTGGTWVRLAEQMDGGYVPTLAELPARTAREKRRNQAIRELADRLEARGWTVWRGSGK